eukprot:3940772-Rhodomonas_salina.2
MECPICMDRIRSVRMATGVCCFRETDVACGASIKEKTLWTFDCGHVFCNKSAPLSLCARSVMSASDQGCRAARNPCPSASIDNCPLCQERITVRQRLPVDMSEGQQQPVSARTARCPVLR